VRLLLALLIMAAPANAGPKKVFHWVGHHKLPIAISLAYLAADFADTKTTVDAMKRCPGCVETSDLYGSHPSPARLWGESAAFDAGYVAVAFYGTSESSLMGTKGWTAEEKAKNPKLYKLCWLEKPGTVLLFTWFAEGHARAAYRNAQIPNRRIP